MAATMPTSPEPGARAGSADERLSRLVHDLRTPLMIVSGFADLLADRDDLTPAQRADFTHRIADAAGELRRILDRADAADAADASPGGSASGRECSPRGSHSHSG